MKRYAKEGAPRVVGGGTYQFREKLVVGDKKGEEAEGRKRRGGGGGGAPSRRGGGGERSRQKRRFLPEGRFMMSIPVLSFVLAFDERKKMSADYTSKKNTYIVLCRNSFRCCGSPTFSGSFTPKFHIPCRG